MVATAAILEYVTKRFMNLESPWSGVAPMYLAKLLFQTEIWFRQSYFKNLKVTILPRKYLSNSVMSHDASR